MNKEETIKDICKIICATCAQFDGCAINCKAHRDTAGALYIVGYRKIDKNCAVITKAELKEYKRKAVKEFAERLKEKCSDYLYDTNYDGKNYFDIHIGEILRMFDELLKEYER